VFPPSPARRRFLGIKPGRPAAVEVGPDSKGTTSSESAAEGQGGAGLPLAETLKFSASPRSARPGREPRRNRESQS
jgi:hypothetical protein